MRVFIVIPAYNEEKVIGDVLTELKSHGFDNIIVVDDGSMDSTFEAAKTKTKYVLRHFINRGKGAAVKTGIEAAKIFQPDAIVIFDADGQHNPREILQMIAKIEEGYEVVLGRRRHIKDRVPPLRILGNYLGNFFTWLIHGVWVHDSQCGFRAFSKSAYSLIDTKTDRYEYESEVVREIKKHRLNFIQILVKVRYTEYSRRKADKMNFRNAVRMIGRMIISSN